MSTVRVGAAVAALTLAAAALRLWGLGRGFEADELAILMSGGFWDIASDPSGGVNPPGLRLLLNLAFPVQDALPLGRLLSLVCGIAAVPLAFRAGRLAGGTAVGLYAAALVAAHPVAAEMSTVVRSYSIWLALALWHVGSVLEVTRQARRTRAVGVALSAALLVQVHYVSVPLMVAMAATLAVVAPGRRLWMLYVPAAVTTLPLAGLVLGAQSRWHDPADGGLTRGLVDIFGLGLGWFFALAAVLAGVVCLRKRLQPAVLALLGGLGGLLVSAVIMGSLHRLTPFVAVFGLPFLAPLLGLMPGPRRGVWLLVALWPLQSLARSFEEYGEPKTRDAARRLGEDWREFTAPGEVIQVHPGHLVDVLRFQELGLLRRDSEREPACGEVPLCFTVDGRRFEGGGQDPVVGLVLRAERDAPDRLPEGCEALVAEAYYALARCDP